jgi:DNA modification methylase
MINFNCLAEGGDFNSYGDSNVVLFQDDCLKVMDYLIEQNIQVDCILTDPPYG